MNKTQVLIHLLIKIGVKAELFGVKSLGAVNVCNGDQNQFEFHTEWSDCNAHAAGFTTAWPPNKQILGRSMYLGMDLDLNGLNEELGGPTFAAINSRSYHPGGVDALLGDGSVKFIESSIDGMVWRGLGTVAGGEVISADAY